MEEKEIDKIFKPKNKLWFLLIIYLSIAIICIGALFYMIYTKKREPLDLTQIVSQGTEEEGQFVKLDIAYLPKLLASTPSKDNQLYYVTDTQNHIYIVRISNTTINNLKEINNEATGKLNSIYQIKGITYNIDAQIERLALYSSNKIWKENELNANNFSEYLGKVYVEEKNAPESEQLITIYKILALVGVFFLILVFGYIVPGILKARKVLNDKDLVDELRTELKNIKDTPYKNQHIYLTKNYIIYGIQAIKYEDIVWIYIHEESRYGIKIAKDLVVHTKYNKRHIVGSVGIKNNILDDILGDIYNRNTNIKVGYNKENREFFKNYKR